MHHVKACRYFVCKNFLFAKTKRSHAYKGYVSSYNVETLNSFNPELQLQDTKSAIRNKLINLLSELKYYIIKKI